MIYLLLLVLALQRQRKLCLMHLLSTIRHLFSRLSHPNLFNDSSTRSCPETLIIFGAFLCTYFYSSVGGRRWVQHPQSNSGTTNIGREPLRLWRKSRFLQEEFNTPKASCVLVLHCESHLQDAACALVPWLKAFGLLAWRANEFWSRNDSAVQFCHLQLTSETTGGPTGKLLSGDGQTTPCLNNLPR